MIQDLSAIVARFSGSDWMDASASLIREYELGRRRAAQLLHDDAGQLLSAAGLHAGLVSMENPATAPHLREFQNLLDQGLAQIRELSRALNPSPVSRTGLRFALEHQIEQGKPAFPQGLTLEFPADFRIPAQPALSLGLFTGYCLEFLRESGANFVHLRVIKSFRAYVLEVLYDESSHACSVENSSKYRRDLLVLYCRTVQSGVAVEYGDGTDSGLIRAMTEDQDCTT